MVERLAVFQRTGTDWAFEYLTYWSFASRRPRLTPSAQFCADVGRMNGFESVSN